MRDPDPIDPRGGRLRRRTSAPPSGVSPVEPDRPDPDDPLRATPRIPVGGAVVADLETLRAAERAVVLTDGQTDLVVMVPVELYRAQLVALAHHVAGRGNAAAASASRHAVLDQEELDALLSDWDHSRGPRPVGPVGSDPPRKARVSDPPGVRRLRRPR